MPKDKTPFLKPIFRGDRFEDHSLPLELVPELRVYESFVIEVAKKIWLTRNPKRKRIPKGFVKSFQLSLKQIHKGSAAPELVREPQSPTLFEEPDEFFLARDLISLAVDAVGRGEPIPAEFPEELLCQFARFGQRLREGESVELLSPGVDKGPTYDPAVRKKLLLTKASAYPKEVCIFATIFEVDLKKQSFQVQEVDGDKRSITCVLSSEVQSDVLAAISDYEKVILRITGVGEHTPDDVLQRIDKIEEIEVFDATDPTVLEAIEKRLDELRALAEGWLEGGGEKIADQSIGFVGDFLKRLIIERGVPKPFLYPTTVGGLQAEWDEDRWEVSAEFDFTRGQVLLNATDLESGEEHSAESPLDSEDLEADVAGFVLKFVRAQ